MPETHQALLYDKTAGTHVLVELGKTLDGYTVQDIDEDEVTLEADGGTEIVLVAPEWRHRADREDDRAESAKPPVKPAAPQDPYAAPAPQDPYAQPAVRVVEAPAAAPATAAAPAPVPTVSAASASTTAVATAAPAPVTTTPAPAPTATATAPAQAPTVTTGAPAPAPTVTTAATAPAPTATPAVIISIPPSATPAAPAAPPTAAAIVAPAPAARAADSAAWSSTPAPPPSPMPMLARADVNAALSNFAKLAGSVHGSFTADGARLDSIAADSLFAKVGLRAGDVITSVNGQPLRSLDDAATLYARAPGMKAVTLAVVRAGKPLGLRVVIQ
ncbi:MAG TPA: PDZ domain-containing protein [Kofleriaceae bacterium]